MKFLTAVLLASLSSAALAAQPALDLPSCDLAGQRALPGEIGGSVKDAGQAHISERANVLVADIGTSRKARHITQDQAEKLTKRIESVRSQTEGFVKEQGFLSAGERASFDREFDAIAQKLCKPV